ncbi:MAG: mechanosensitive ion channel [Actinomycetota bacterium]|nr:mechanosensitive ion channel [Actinomycetota bacterium]MDA2971877.1 mechanosensitive ion channel [Actinomycetota bacterium]MDA3001205.1 mechanosensitive ion channel [Actinomycetota bacterium]
MSLLSTLSPSPDETSASEVMSRPLLVVIIVVGAMITTRLTHLTVRRVVRRVSQRSANNPSRWWRTRIRYGEYESAEIGESRRQQRADAAARMIHHVFAVFLWIGVLIAVFHVLELDAAFFLSSAGFIGAGLAIGGQHKVNDYLTGLSVLVEDRYGIGDEIEVSTGFTNGVRGNVEHIGLVSTRVRDGFSTVHMPHSALLSVRNLSQEPIETRLAIQVPGDFDRADVASRAAETIRELAGTPHLTDVVLVRDVASATPIEGHDQLELKVVTAKPLSPHEREILVRRTEERLNAQDG